MQVEIHPNLSACQRRFRRRVDEAQTDGIGRPRDRAKWDQSESMSAPNDQVEGRAAESIVSDEPSKCLYIAKSSRE
jgi:hypothetical protein